MPLATKYNKKWESLPQCQGWLSALKLSDGKESTERAKCSWCHSDFSIKHGGLNDVNSHERTKKHQEFVKVKMTTKPVVKCFDDKENLQNAAKEGMVVYHMIRHNYAFKSMACTSEMIRLVFDQTKFACSATKASAIVTGVFEPMILNQIQLELNEAMYVCLGTDTSSHKEVTMYPIIARYFLPLEGIKTRLIDFSNLFSETGKDIFGVLKTTWEKYNIREKVSSYSADNCKTNFGNVDREGGKLNVFTRLKEALGNNLVGVGCTAHILHNAPEDACLNALPFDIQHILVLIYKQFYTSTKQTEALKQFCDEMSMEFSKVKGCPSTRFLAKKDSIISVLKIFEALKEYFSSKPTKKVPVLLRNFFSDPLSKLYLIIVRDLCEIFENAILKIEGNQTTGVEAVKIVDDLKRTLETTIAIKFLSLDTEKEVRNIAQLDPTFDETDVFDRYVYPIYGKSLNYSIESEVYKKIIFKYSNRWLLGLFGRNDATLAVPQAIWMDFTR